MPIIITLLGLIILCRVFYKLSAFYSSKIFLTLHSITFIILACVLYPLLVRKSGLYIFSTFVFFLPIIFTIRLFEINQQKMKEQKMRQMN